MILLHKQFRRDHPSGSVNRDEFAAAFSFDDTGREMRRGLHDYTDLVFEAFDADRSGTITFNEYITFLGICLRGTQEEKLMFTFDLHGP